MLAFGCATTNEEEYFAYAAPTIERISEDSSLIMRRHGYDSIHEPYNDMLVEASDHDDLEAVVLLHQDLSIADAYFAERVRALLALDERVAVIGAAGARNVTGLAWWEGDSLVGRVEAPLMAGDADFARGIREVEAVDGVMLVLSAWAARELRFDPALGPFDGYDVDLCFQARARGRRVVVGDFRGVTHYARDSFFDRARWTNGARALSRKWDPDLIRGPV